MITLEQFRDAYLDQDPNASEEEIGRGYLRVIGGPSIAAELGSGLQRGVGQLINAIGTAVKMVSGERAGQSAVELGELIIKDAPRHPELLGSILDRRELLAEPAWWAGGIAEMIPALATQAGAYGMAAKAGLSAKAAMGTAAGTGGALEGLPVYNELREQGTPQLEAVARTGANVAGIGALNLLPLSRAFGYGPTRGILNRITTTGLAEGVTETAEEPLQAIITGNDPVQALYDGFNVFPVAAVTGGLLGGAGSISQASQGQLPPSVEPGPEVSPATPEPTAPTPPPQPQLTPEQQADALNDTPLKRQVDLDNAEVQFDESGAPVETPVSNWIYADGRHDYKVDLVPKQSTIYFEQDNTLGTILDNEDLFNDYPQLRNTIVGRIPKQYKGMDSRSVPGRIELTPNKPPHDARLRMTKRRTAALEREVKRQIAYIEGTHIPAHESVLTPEQSEVMNKSLLEMYEAEGIDLDSRAAEIAMMHAHHVISPGKPRSIQNIRENQGDVDLSITPKEARTLVSSRKLDTVGLYSDQTKIHPDEEAAQQQAATEVVAGQEQPSDPLHAAASEAALPLLDRTEPIPGEDGPAMVPIREKIGNIRMDKLGMQPINQETLAAAEGLNEEFINNRRRMPGGDSRPIAADRKEALRILQGVSGTTMHELIHAGVGQAYNSGQIIALSMSLEGATRQTHRAINRYNEDPTEVNRFKAQEAFTVMRSIHSAVSASRSEAGRALRILQEPMRESEKMTRLSQLYDNFNDVLDAMASGRTLGEINATAAAYERKSTFMDRLMEIWLANLLTGGTTHVVNMVSNWATARIYTTELRLAALVGKARGQGDMTWAEVHAYAMSNAADGFEALRQSTISWKTEADVFQASKLDTNRYKAWDSKRMGLKKDSIIIDKLGRGIRVPFRLLMASDAYFKTRAYRRRLRQMAVRNTLLKNPNATKQELADAMQQAIDRPTAAQVKDAEQHANYLTFTNKTGPIASALKQVAADHPLVKLVMPFVSTPANIIKFALARTPFGAMMMPSMRNALSGRLGEDAKNQAIAQVSVGSAIMGAVGYMVATGLITGAPPRDPRERSLWYAQNAQPYSVRVGDNWYAYGRIEPLGMVMGMAADFVQMYQFMDADDKEVQQMGGALVAGMAQNLLSKTWLKGISDVVLAITDPQRYGQMWAHSFTGTLIPTGIAQLERANDPMLRYSTSVWEHLQTRIPGMAANIPVRVDAFGRDINLSPRGVPPLVNFFNPIYIREVEDDPVAKELLKMKVSLSTPRKKFGAYRLTPTEAMDYARVHGQMAHRMLGAAIQAPAYQYLPSLEKVRILEKVRKKASTMARKMFMATNPHIEYAKVLAEIEDRASFTERELTF